jgi:hypothetical protein
MATLDVLARPRTSPCSHEVSVVDESGAPVGALSRADLAHVFTSGDHVLGQRIEDLLRDHYATAEWRVQVVGGLVTISGTFLTAERWSLMSFMRLIPGVEGLVLCATAAPLTRLD